MTCDYNAAVSRSQQTEVVRPRRCMVYSRPSLMKLSVNGTNIWASIHLLVVANIIRPHRNTMYIDAAYCYRWSSVVCHDCQPCKTAEPIKLPFGLWTWVGPRKHVWTIHVWRQCVPLVKLLWPLVVTFWQCWSHGWSVVTHIFATTCNQFGWCYLKLAHMLLDSVG